MKTKTCFLKQSCLFRQNTAPAAVYISRSNFNSGGHHHLTHCAAIIDQGWQLERQCGKKWGQGLNRALNRQTKSACCVQHIVQYLPGPRLVLSKSSEFPIQSSKMSE
uniref:Uncharacterized protein n=1 Tax=Spongospora subterranea TaxID=70186 RepID=A0A0H5R4W4_9EUKA|eukprot:CRZ03144.1 hypothetical protein [Spongospora subterranea]